MWLLVIIVLLIILIATTVGLTAWTQKNNNIGRQTQALLPFSGYLAPSGIWSPSAGSLNVGTGAKPEDGLYLANTVGDPQIQCPAGTSVNIVGAFLDIVDPYGECPGSTDPTLLATCGVAASTQSCKTEKDCSTGMTCTGAGVCTPKTCTGANNICGSSTVGTCAAQLGNTCSVSSDCGSDGTLSCVGGFCVVDPSKGSCMACVDQTTGSPLGSTDSSTPGTCAFLPVCTGTIGGANSTCSSTGVAGCRPRDASAYLAKHCDGKQSCLGKGDLWIPGTEGGVFGPLPCQISADSTDITYASLPVSMGWGGSSPQNSASGDSTPANFNQGYYVHGIYTCKAD